MRALGLAVICALLFTAGAVDAARHNGAPKPKLLNLDDASGWVEVGVRGRNSRRERPSAGTTFSRDDVKIDEIAHLDLDGFVYYPRLLRFHIGSEVHFLQNPTTGDDQILPLGDFRLTFLEKKPFGLTLFALVSEDEVEETFGRSFETRIENYGASARFGLGPLPFHLRYAHRIRDRSGDSSIDVREEGDEIVFTGLYRLRARSDGNVRFAFSDVMERGQRIQRHELMLNNLTYFDPERRKRLTALARYYDWSGRSDISNASLLGTYSWRHTDRITSTYQASYQNRMFESQSTHIFDASAGASHRLYSSLDSHLLLFGSFQDASFGKVGEFGARLAEGYSKQLGDWGALAVGMTPYVRLQQTRPSRDTAFVSDERVVFPSGNPAQLRQRDIDVTSIVVTSTDGTVTYQESFDYEIRVLGDRTEIERLLSGNIPSGSPVSVSYRYSLGNEHDLLSYGYRGNLSITYHGVGEFFSKLSANREEVTAGFSGRRLDDRNRYEIGYRTRGRWMSTTISIDWEQASHRPSMGTLQSVSLTSPWSGMWRGSVSLTHSTRKYHDPRERVNSWRLHGRLSLGFGGTGVLQFDPEYRIDNWSGEVAAQARDLEAVGGTLSLRWSFRAIQFKLGASLFRLERPAVEELQDRFFVQIRRSF